MILAIIAAVLAYRKAKENGRNGILWALAAVATFIGTQLLVSLGLGMLIGLGQVMWGWGDDVYTTYEWPVTLVAIVASFVATLLLLRYIDSSPEPDTYVQAPPPPPTFGNQ